MAVSPPDLSEHVERAMAAFAQAGEEVTVAKDRFVATREEGIFAKADDATVIAEAGPPSGKILRRLLRSR